jgi:hypothetical protein
MPSLSYNIIGVWLRKQDISNHPSRVQGIQTPQLLTWNYPKEYGEENAVKSEIWGTMAFGFALADFAVFDSATIGADWPQYQHDARHSGFTFEEVNPPYKVAWKRCFLPERVARRSQAIVYDCRVFVGTQQGAMYYFDADTGEVLENLNVSCGGRYVFILHCEEGNANYTGVYEWRQGGKGQKGKRRG